VSPATLLAAEFTGAIALGLAVLAALGGGWLGSWITSWKDLEQQRREIEQQARVRMLEAADAFIAAASVALAEVRALDPSVQEQELYVGRWERLTLGDVPVEPSVGAEGLTPEMISRVNKSRAEASRHLRRVELIFGPAAGGLSTSVVDAATATVTRIRDAWEALQAYYAVAQAAESKSVARRREVVEIFAGAVGAAGLQRVASHVPNLADALNDLASRTVAGAVVNVQRSLDKAIERVTKAMAEAEAALKTFSTDASLALVAAPIQARYEVRYRIGTDEKIRPVLVRKRRFLSTAVPWLPRFGDRSAVVVGDGSPHGEPEGSSPAPIRDGGDRLEG
jgi:hypothetical protein